MRAAFAGVALGIAMVAVPAWGQPAPTVLSVEELLAGALGGHPELRAARLEVEAAEARVRQAGLRPNPTIDLGGQKALGPDNNVMIGLTVPLDLNGRKEGRIAVAEAEVIARRAQLAERERRLRAELRAKAGDVLAAGRALETTTALLDANRQALDLVRERVRGGAAPALDENLQLVEVNRLDSNARLLHGRVDALTQHLFALAAWPTTPPPKLAGELSGTPVPITAEDAAQRALARRPDLAAARAETAVAAARVRKEETEGRWDASVNVGYQRQDFGYDLRGLTATGGTRPIQDVFHYFGAGVSVMLPVRNRNQGNIAAVRAEEQATHRRLELMQLTVRYEVAAAFAQHEAARQALAAYERGVRDIARRNVEVVRQAWGLGRGSLLDVIAEQRRLIEIEAAYTETLKAVWDAVTEIERALAAPLR